MRLLPVLAILPASWAVGDDEQYEENWRIAAGGLQRAVGYMNMRQVEAHMQSELSEEGEKKSPNRASE